MFRVFGVSFLTTRNMKPETHNSVLWNSGATITIEGALNNTG